MVKKNTPRKPAGFRAVTQTDITTSIAHANMGEVRPTIYANHVQFTSNKSEFIIDLFFIAPDPLGTPRLKTNYLQRIILSADMAKGFLTAMSQSIVSQEEITAINPEHKQMENQE